MRIKLLCPRLPFRTRPVTISRFHGSVVAGALLFFCSRADVGGTQAPSKAGPAVGKADATWNFWRAVNEAAVATPGIEALGRRAWQGKTNARDTWGVLGDVIAGEQARSEAITTLPVLDVDPDLAQYAVEFARTRSRVANALQDYLAVVKEQEQCVSPPVLGAGLLINVISHANDKEDGRFWRALLDETTQTAVEFRSLKEPSQRAEAKLVAARAALSRLKPDEMAVRAKLAQRYGQEFPPLDLSEKTAELEKPNQAAFSKREVIDSLIGQHVGGVFDFWSFDSPREFVSLEILKIGHPGPLRTDYVIRAHVKGLNSGEERDLKLRLRYGWLYTRWVLVGVEPIS